MTGKLGEIVYQNAQEEAGEASGEAAAGAAQDAGDGDTIEADYEVVDDEEDSK